MKTKNGRWIVRDESGMALHEGPEARMAKYGAQALSDGELVAALCGGDRLKAVDKARELVAAAGNLPALAGWDLARMARTGIPRGFAERLVAAMEIGRRMTAGVPGVVPILDVPDEVANHMSPVCAGLEVEKFWVLCLNRKGRLIKRVEVSSGIASSTLVHPREVFRTAIMESASGIICVHNHPSGDPSPSAQDIRITRTLREAGATVDITVIDHLIMGRRECDPLGVGFWSFQRSGM